MPKETGLLMQPWGVEATIKGIKEQTSRVFKIPNRKRLGQPRNPDDDDLSWVESAYQDGGGNWILWSFDPGPEFTKKQYPTAEGIPCPYGKVGDLLYIREPHYAYGYWAKNGLSKTGKQKWIFKTEKSKGVLYIDNPPSPILSNTAYNHHAGFKGWYKRSPLFMPKCHARHWLKVSGVQLRRIQTITDEESIKEGIQPELIYPDEYPDREKGVIIYGAGYDSPICAFRSIWDNINEKRGHGWDKNPLTWMIQYKYLGANKATEV